MLSSTVSHVVDNKIRDHNHNRTQYIIISEGPMTSRSCLRSYLPLIRARSLPPFVLNQATHYFIL